MATGVPRALQTRFLNWSKALIICDKFFSPSDVFVLKYVLECGNKVAVRVLCSPHEQCLSNGIEGLTELYKKEWRVLSSEMPPTTFIALVETIRSKYFPVHDRWLLTENAGLRIGTSLNSIGLAGQSEISTLDHSEVQVRFKECAEILSMTRNEFRNERLEYRFIAL